MGKTTWKKALINSAHTFMSYVNGWRGWQSTNFNSEKLTAGTWVVPEKITPLSNSFPQTVVTDDGQGTSMDFFYNLPFEIGFQGTLRRYRYPENNEPYESLNDFQQSNGLGKPCVKIDYRNNISQHWGKNSAGIAISGAVSNYLEYGTDIEDKYDSGNTVWRRLSDPRLNLANLDVNDICSAQLVEQNTQQPINGTYGFGTQKSPFRPQGNGSQFDMGEAGLWKVPRRNNRYGRLLDSKKSNSKRRETFSFYIWNGALNKEWVTDVGSYRSLPCSAIEGGFVNLNANTLNNGKLACQFQSSLDGIEDNWSSFEDNVDTYFTIDFIERKFDQFSPIIGNSTAKKNYRIIDNVQFEDCPNNYTRLSIFFKPNPEEETSFRYTRFAWYTSTMDTTAEDVYNGIKNPPQFSAPKLAGQTWKDRYLIMFGQQLEVSTNVFDSGNTVLNLEYVHNDYIPNNSNAVRNNSLTQLAIPNFVELSNSVPDTNDRCETIYFSLWLQNQDSRPNVENSGGSTNAGRDFANIHQRIYSDNSGGGTPTVTDRNRQFITLGNDFRSDFAQYDVLTEFQKRNTRYVMYLSENVNQNAQGNYLNLEQIEGLNFIYLNTGLNKFAFNTGSNKVYVNGKAYATDDDHFNAKFIQRIEFYGKRQDYLLEYGTWKENQADDVLIQLTKV